MYVSALDACNDGSLELSECKRTQIAQVAIIGTGIVGSTTAYALLNSDCPDRSDRRRAEGNIQNLRDAEVFSQSQQYQHVSAL